MEFETVELRYIRLPLKHAFETSFGRFEERNLAVLAAKKEGNWYYGEASAQRAPLYQHETTSTDMKVLENFIVPTLKSSEGIQDYDQRVKRFRGNPMAKAAGDFLLHHLESVRSGTSLAELAGGKPGHADCGISVGMEETVEEVVEKVDRYVSQSFSRVKLKIEPGSDIQYLEAVREKFPEIALMADANASYTLEHLERLKKLDRFNMIMIEQPFGYRDIVNHSILADEIETPICLDESIKSAEDVKRAAEIGACDIVNLKPQRVGGLSESRRIDRECQKAGIDTWIGGLIESGIGASFAVAAAGLNSVAYPNDLAPSGRYFEEDIIEPEIEMQNGSIEIPDRPELCGEVNRQKLEKYTVEKKVL